MQRWTASGMTEITVELWYGDSGTGWIELYELQGGSFVSLAHNPSVALPLDKQLPPSVALKEMSIKAIAADVSGADLPLYIRVSQNGQTLPADDGIDPINGSGPYDPVLFDDKAANNLPTYYYFNVRFK